MRAFRLSLPAVFLVACASTPQGGMMVGQWTLKSGLSEKVPISWESTGKGHGTIHATLGKGGEHFHGKYVRVESGQSEVKMQTVYDDWNAPSWAALDWGPEGNYGVSESVDFKSFLHDYTGRVVATLFGNRDHSMRCQFTLEDPQRGMKSGGVGLCQVSDGSRIDVQF